jgi:hypothetical protein
MEDFNYGKWTAISHQAFCNPEFLHHYISFLKRQGIPVKPQPWFRRDVEHYIRTIRKKQLQPHTAADLADYLEQTGRNSRYLDWQVAQVTHALKIFSAFSFRSTGAGVQLGVLDQWDKGAAAVPCHDCP